MQGVRMGIKSVLQYSPYSVGICIQTMYISTIESGITCGGATAYLLSKILIWYNSDFLKDSIVGYFWVIFENLTQNFGFSEIFAHHCIVILETQLQILHFFDLIFWKILDFWPSLQGDFDTFADFGIDFDFFKGSIVLYF